MHQFLNDLLNLPDTQVTDYKIVGNKIYIDVESTTDEGVMMESCVRSDK